MKKNIFAFITLLTLATTLFSCEDSYNSNLKVMRDTFRKQLEDSLFKANATIKIYESNVIGYDTIDDLYFMNGIRDIVLNRISYEKLYLADFSEVASPFGESMDKSEINTIRDYKKNIKDLEAILDSIDGQKYRKSKEHYYLYKEYIKATITSSDGKNENTMDTISVAFNKNLEEIICLDKCSPEIRQLFKRVTFIAYDSK